MKKVINIIKKAAKYYFNQSAKIYVPSCTIPCLD